MDANSHEAGGIFDCGLYSRPDPLEARAANAGPPSLRPDLLLDVRAPGCRAKRRPRLSSVRQSATVIRIDLREGIPPIILIRKRY